MTILRCEQLNKTYTEGPNEVEVLRNINLTIKVGDKAAIVGASGSGKSTLLHLLGGLDLPSSGEIWAGEQQMSSLSDKERGEFRNQNLGFIYQFHHLLPEFTAVENVAMPLLIRGEDTKLALKKAEQLLVSIGLAKRLQHRPVELSGGERQRTAIARALVTQPKCVLADEPTGNLDYKTAETVFDTMLQLNDQVGTALVMVTHDLSLAERMGKVLHLVDGEFEKD